ncbi:hypothetical protein MASR2M39_31400 [Ignavibacteriales bacterium]
MKKVINPRLLISIFTLMLVPLLNIYAQTTPFFVMSLQDKDKYIQTDISWAYTSLTTTKSIHQSSVDSMKVHDGIKFYRGYFISPSSYFGMDEASNKLYFLNNSNKFMMLDFNIPPGGSFTGYLPGSSAVTITVGGSESVRGFSYSYNSAQGGGSIGYTVERGLGFTQFVSSQSISNGRGFSVRLAPYNQIRFNQNGDTIYKVETWAPKISYTTETTTKVFLKTFNVNTNHDLNTQLSKYIPAINFNDSLFIGYFYTNGIDSTAPIVKGIAAAAPTTTFSLQLDSMKMKAGYKFKYKFTLRDKFYRPKLVYHPSSTGYNTLSCDSSLLSKPASPQIPVSIDLEAFPNPVSINNNSGKGSVTIRFNMPTAGYADGTVYDILGRDVAKIVDGVLPAGENSIKFNAEGLSSGMYVFRLATKSGSEFIKILVTK